MKPFSLVKYLLFPFAFIYGAVLRLRNGLYDSGFYSSVSFDVPVISVGNLNTGGTGKTPHIEYLVRLLQYQFKTATMSRGYKRRTRGFLIAGADANALKIGDEPMQYVMKFPELTVSVAEDRMTGIPSLMQRYPDIDVILLDDAYQHRSVKPDINILITDYHKPFYEDRILPYGRLREGRKAYSRADIIIVSKCPKTLTEEEATAMRTRINPFSHQQVFFTCIQYGAPYDFYTREESSYTNKAVIMLCGIANPAPLEATLQAEAKAVHPLVYRDHHFYLSNDLEEIKEAYNNWQEPEKLIVTTEKDAARLHLVKDLLQEMGLPILVLPMQIAFLFQGNKAFDEFITAHVSENSPHKLPELPSDTTFEEF